MLGFTTLSNVVLDVYEWFAEPDYGDYLPPEHEDRASLFRDGDLVTDGKRVGILQFIEPSPYFNEEVNGIERAFVVALNGGWSDYWLIEETDFAR